jgi:hypothetical protein
MPNVTFKFVITETPLPADQDGRQQIIASISDDNAKRITDLPGLAGEVEALKAHCHRMLNLARNRYLGYCDHNRATQAVIEEFGRMGVAPSLPPTAVDSADVLTMLAEMTLDRDRLDGRVAGMEAQQQADALELFRHRTRGDGACAERDKALADLAAARAELNNARTLTEATRQDLVKANATVASLVEHAPPGHPLHSCGGPQEACMQPGCAECGCPTMEQALALKSESDTLAGLLQDAQSAVGWVAIQTGDRKLADRITAALASRKKP